MKSAEMNVSYIDHYGSDLLITNAARVSFNKRKETFDYGDHKGSDERLIKYLAREKHFTPFCHPHVTLHVKAPLFVARQLVKHQIGGTWSEVSRRYVDTTPELWFPEEWRSRPEGSIKQGSSTAIGEDDSFDVHHEAYEAAYASVKAYDFALARGVAPELARILLPQNMMTEWFWTGSLLFFTRVCKQRLDAHAQLESREVAERISEVVAPLFPVSWSALMEVRHV